MVAMKDFTVAMMMLTTISTLRKTEKTRLLLLKTVGANDGKVPGENDFVWDYGQMMAVMTWFPVFWQLISLISSCIFLLPRNLMLIISQRIGTPKRSWNYKMRKKMNYQILDVELLSAML